MYDKGWTAAGALQAGDKIATRSGEWVAVAEVDDTEQWETVYNVRVADHHTYFVGEESWGFDAWAHNAYIILYRYKPLTSRPPESAHWSIEIESNSGKPIHTDLTVDVSLPPRNSTLQDWLNWTPPAMIARQAPGPIPGLTVDKSNRIVINDSVAQKARTFAANQPGNKPTTYSLVMNSCFTYVTKVLQQAGFNLTIPTDPTDVSQMDKLLAQLNILLDKRFTGP